MLRFVAAPSRSKRLDFSRSLKLLEQGAASSKNVRGKYFNI
jgi:hypothetical protein